MKDKTITTIAVVSLLFIAVLMAGILYLYILNNDVDITDNDNPTFVAALAEQCVILDDGRRACKIGTQVVQAGDVVEQTGDVIITE